MMHMMHGGGRVSGMYMAGGGSSIHSLASQLQQASNVSSASYDPELAHLQSIELLNSLCEALSLIANEGELSGLRVNELCTTLVKLLTDQGESPDCMRQSTRTRANRRLLLSVLLPLLTSLCSVCVWLFALFSSVCSCHVQPDGGSAWQRLHPR
jgi:hypothetical protein